MSRQKTIRRLEAGAKWQLIAGNGTPLRSQKQLPNDPCRCGSTKKAKRCCGMNGAYLNTKPNPVVDAQLLKAGFKKIQA